MAKVWVIPGYRAASLAVEAAALAINIPAVVEADASLPLVRFACDTWTASPELSCIFAQGLRIVVDMAHGVLDDGPTVLGSVTHVISGDNFGDVGAGFVPDVKVAIRQAFSSAGAADGHGTANDPAVLYPVHTSDLVEYILGDLAFETQLMFTCYYDSRPFDIWEYVRWSDRTIDIRMLVRDAADLFASEQGGDLSQRVLRESQAYRLYRAVRESLSEVTMRLDPRLLQAARNVGLSPSAMERIEHVVEQCSTQLAVITLETLLAPQ